MTTSLPKDALIFEDRPDEVRKIADWLGLIPAQYTFCPRFSQAQPGESYPEDERDRGWQWIESEIRRVDPKLVVFDYLLAKERGAESFDGLYYGNRCKSSDYWPELAVVLVTTGGERSLTGQVHSQDELDQQRAKLNWPIDAAWIKPWGTAAASVSQTKVQSAVHHLLQQSRRPSEHKRGK